MDRKTRRWLSFSEIGLAVILAVLFAACKQTSSTAGSTPDGDSSSHPPISTTSALASESVRPAGDSLPAVPSIPCFFETLCEDTLRKAGLENEDNPFEQIRLAYLYVVTNTHYIPLINETLSDSWRGLDFCGTPPSVYQAEALGPLYYGLGSCENYSAALLVLLQHLGFEAKYVTGLTYSVEGILVDHAWAMVRIDDTWYHIDPQLEDDVTHDGVVRWRFWMKSDEAFAADHVWGSALETADTYALALPECPVSANPPVLDVQIEKPPRPDLAVAQEVAAALIAQGEANVGLEIGEPLPPLPRNMNTVKR